MIDIPPAVVGAASALGALVLKEWIPGAFRWFTGGVARQKSLTLEAQAEREHAEAERDRAREERDEEARAKRVLEVHCTALTRYLIESGWQARDPRLDWPKY